MFFLCLSACATLYLWTEFFFLVTSFSLALSAQSAGTIIASLKMRDHYEIFIWKLPGKPLLLGTQFSPGTEKVMVWKHPAHKAQR